MPGSGKSWLANKVAPLLGLRVIDKDDILEALFLAKGIGDAAWRRALSRESDAIFQREAQDSEGAVLVSFWRLPGMSAGSGTPTSWLADLSGVIVNLHCECPPEVAARRFADRKRHPGHLDHTRSPAEILMSIRETARLQRFHIGETVWVDTSREIRMEELGANIASVFERAKTFKRRPANR